MAKLRKNAKSDLLSLKMRLADNNILQIINTHQNLMPKTEYDVSAYIYEESRSKCGCGSSKYKKEYYDELQRLTNGIKVPRCESCNAYPEKFRIVLSVDGKKVTLRSDKTGSRFEKIEQVLTFLNIIKSEVITNSFSPLNYASKSDQNSLIFEVFIKNYMLIQKKRLERNIITQSGYTNKEQAHKHLNNFFKGKDIRNIGRADVNLFNETYECGERAKSLALSELKTILKFAYAYEYISRIPDFPKIQSARHRDAENFLEPHEFKKVLDAIDSIKAKTMIEIMAIYAMRPCEIRALQWRDIDFFNKTITLARHFTRGNQLVDFRKSDSRAHNKGLYILPLTERVEALLGNLPVTIRKDDFVFKGDKLSYVSDRVLNRAWTKALEVTGTRKIDLYEGARHSRLTELYEKYGKEKTMIFSDHATEAALGRYAVLKGSKKLEIRREMLAGI